MCGCGAYCVFCCPPCVWEPSPTPSTYRRSLWIRPLRPLPHSFCIRLSCRLRVVGTLSPPPLCFVRVLSLSVLLFVTVLSLRPPPSVALSNGVRRGIKWISHTSKPLFNPTHLTILKSASPGQLSTLEPTPTVGVDASAAAPGRGLQSLSTNPAPLFPLPPWWLPPLHPSFLRRLQAAIHLDL